MAETTSSRKEQSMGEVLEQNAHLVLRKTTEYFRTHRHVWSGKNDTLSPIVSKRNRPTLEKALELGQFETSIDTLIQAYCYILSRRDRDAVNQKACRLIYDAHKLYASGWCSIAVYNDRYCAGVDDAIVYLEKSFKHAKADSVGLIDESLCLQEQGVFREDVPQATPSHA